MRCGWLLLLSGCAATVRLPMVPSLADAPASLRKPLHAEVAFHCSHPDAEVVLDGVPQGTCEDYDGEPRALRLGHGRSGSHRLAVRKQGFTTWESWLEADGTRIEVDVTLLSVTGGSTP